MIISSSEILSSFQSHQTAHKNIAMIELHTEESVVGYNETFLHD